ncbi:MAG: hypothetical protein MK212_06360 [Saprospiraceae bacterium]|nr:hypothetical protein [Saprospiraceae bacterium]
MIITCLVVVQLLNAQTWEPKDLRKEQSIGLILTKIIEPKHYQLKGKVKTVKGTKTEINTIERDGKITFDKQEPVTALDLSAGEHGKIERLAIKSEDIRFIYNENNQLIAMRNIRTDFQMAYGDHNKVSEINATFGNGNDDSGQIKIVLTYDENGQLVKEENARAASQNREIKMSYNDQGKLIKVTQKNVDEGVEKAGLEYGYNDEGERIWGKSFGLRDEQVRTLEEITYEQNRVKKIVLLDYYDEGNLKKLPKETILYYYTANGEILMEEHRLTRPSTYESSYVMSYHYTYDEKGNWTKVEIYKNGQLEEIREREITYYE